MDFLEITCVVSEIKEPMDLTVMLNAERKMNNAPDYILDSSIVTLNNEKKLKESIGVLNYDN